MGSVCPVTGRIRITFPGKHFAPGRTLSYLYIYSGPILITRSMFTPPKQRFPFIYVETNGNEREEKLVDVQDVDEERRYFLFIRIIRYPSVIDSNFLDFHAFGFRRSISEIQRRMGQRQIVLGSIHHHHHPPPPINRNNEIVFVPIFNT